jgi:hypothetical protein
MSLILRERLQKIGMTHEQWLTARQRSYNKLTKGIAVGATGAALEAHKEAVKQVDLLPLQKGGYREN